MIHRSDIQIDTIILILLFEGTLWTEILKGELT